MRWFHDLWCCDKWRGNNRFSFSRLSWLSRTLMCWFAKKKAKSKGSSALLIQKFPIRRQNKSDWKRQNCDAHAPSVGDWHLFCKKHRRYRVRQWSDVYWIEEKSLHLPDFLIRHFPENKDDIKAIIQDIKYIAGYLNILCGIDNPLLLDFNKTENTCSQPHCRGHYNACPPLKNWKLHTLIAEYLGFFTKNQILIDMVAQHFYQKIPAFFPIETMNSKPLETICFWIDL